MSKMHDAAKGLLLGFCASGAVFLAMAAVVWLTGSTFGQRCQHEAIPGEAHAACVERLARGRAACGTVTP